MRVLSINTSGERDATFEGPRRTTGIDKRARDGAVYVCERGVEGDAQADRQHHGGPDQAVYAYAIEDYRWWTDRLARPMPPGLFGENLTLVGVDVSGARIGERWSIGGLRLQVTSPRIPCRMFAGWMGLPGWLRLFVDVARPGAYLRVLRPGEIEAGDRVEVEELSTPTPTVADAFRAYYGDWTLLPRLAQSDGVAERWRQMAAHRLRSGSTQRLPDNPPRVPHAESAGG